MASPSSSPSPSPYDVVIIGSGQAGNPLARAFAQAGRRTAVVERVHVGGTCINEGCTPTKTMIASARVAHLARRGAQYGVRDGSVQVDVAHVRKRKQSIVDNFRANSEQGLASAGVELIRGEARFTGARTIEVRTVDQPRTLRAEVVVINTGLRPAIPEIPGLDVVPYLTSTSIMELVSAPEHLVVLGGGYVGLEFAQMFRRFGSRVTILQRGDQLLPLEDADVAEEIATILRDEGIDVVLRASATEVARVGTGIRVAYRVGGSGEEGEANATAGVSGSHLLVATGRTPNSEGMGLSAAGVVRDEHGYIRVDDQLRTTAEQVYAVGDVKGGPAFTHVSYDDFRILRANLLRGGNASTNGRQVPYTVFTDPQLGRIGMTERQARDAGRRIRVARLPMNSVARALETDETRGFMKAVVDADSERILGAAVLGLEGGEIVALLQVAMMGNLPYTVLRDGIFAHPTLAEAMNSLFMALDGDR
jgi:pyruvate/2-oxoglutarate dehydrogenase complex dihydrolipoamide dehydrogenase (E3) component